MFAFGIYVGSPGTELLVASIRHVASFRKGREGSAGGNFKRLTKIITADLHRVRRTVAEIVKRCICIFMDLKSTGKVANNKQDTVIFNLS